MSIKSQQLPWFKGSGRGHFWLRLCAKSIHLVPVVFRVVLGPFRGPLCVPSPGDSAGVRVPDVSERDTVWVTDNAGAGVGSQVWTCDHHYVLQEEVFVNAGDTLRIEPGTVVLGAEGTGAKRKPGGDSVRLWFHQHGELQHHARSVDRGQGRVLGRPRHGRLPHPIFLPG